ncbi:triphosphoribosyl-dephospho-CoA synthase [Halococcoides cellulosivorans]|uniref:Triphosphoribosyl-dephospho-CoA synthase n=1 Tax=Halococcoides cellulosivorans TaxID=1679096 RepID=A0A2R4X0Y5_9EURY|nr:triphosphoribosyl-dephospho-CoA synthase [Halococcoides cellulosivorans]AWB27452.1 triphosphoribosyl-dephospho-CoA synthase [Halococcoides cellulosivorans]
MSPDSRAEPSATERTPAQAAMLALLLEVAATPTPGNVDRAHDHSDLRFEHFLAGAVGALDGLSMAARPDVGLGRAFERAVAGMATQRGGNTQFGGLLVLVPLVRAQAHGALTRDGARAVVDRTTVADSVAFFEAFDHVDVAVDEPPPALADCDVRDADAAIQAVREREIDLGALLVADAARNAIGREYADGFERTFAIARRLRAGEGPVLDRAAAVWLDTLADQPDTLIAIQHDAETAQWASERAQAVREGKASLDAITASFQERSINPGTTADLLAGGLFVALQRGLTV